MGPTPIYAFEHMECSISIESKESHNIDLEQIGKSYRISMGLLLMNTWLSAGSTYIVARELRALSSFRILRVFLTITCKPGQFYP